MPESSEKFLQKTGNYRLLNACCKVEVLYDYTFRFSENVSQGATAPATR